jgi:hypothetical protein
VPPALLRLRSSNGPAFELRMLAQVASVSVRENTIFGVGSSSRRGRASGASRPWWARRWLSPVGVGVRRAAATALASALAQDGVAVPVAELALGGVVVAMVELALGSVRRVGAVLACGGAL